MRHLLPTFLCSLLGASLLALPVAGHGGTYRGPGATAPPGFAPPVNVGPVAIPGATGTGGSPGGGPGQDLLDWALWWRQNGPHYVELKEHVRSSGPGSGTEGWFLGDGQREQVVTLGPTEDSVRGRLVPALLGVLERERANDLLSGALLALAKIGVDSVPDEATRIESAIARFLTDSNQEVRETAAVALGVLASPRSIPTLAHLLWDTGEGQKAVGAREVGYRTRSFAAYGLGLVGARTPGEPDRQLIVSMLRRAFESDDTSTQDLGVACLVSIGIVPLSTIEVPSAQAEDRHPPETSRLAQLDWVLGVFRDRKQERLVRAQCPVTLARLLNGPPSGQPSGRPGVLSNASAEQGPGALPEPHFSAYRATIARELIECLQRGRDPVEVEQSCVLALGQIGTNDDGEGLDNRIRSVLTVTMNGASHYQTRAFAMMALAETGGRFVPGKGSKGLDAVRSLLVEELVNGKNLLQPWAALALGVLGWNVAQKDGANPVLPSLRRVIRLALAGERSVERIGAFALAAGLVSSQESRPRLLELLDKQLPDDARGQVALALGLSQTVEAAEALRSLVADSKYRPATLRQASMALALLGDKSIGTELAELLKDARSTASQAAIATALGFVGDRRALEPLLDLLEDRLATDSARAFAAVGLGNVADKELFPWNMKLGFGLNYRAAPATLSDPATGNGILDLY